MLLDPDSFDLVQDVEAILTDMSGNELEHGVTRELMQSVLEIATPVCRSAADVERPAAYAPQVRGRAALPGRRLVAGGGRAMTTVLP